MTNFENFAIITDGKFVGVWDSTIESFYFGIYNHKYFSFQARYPVAGSDIIIDKFRKVTNDELVSFLTDCEKLGYAYNTVDHTFIDYPLNTLNDFYSYKLPKFVSHSSFVDKTCIDQVRWHNYLIWIFSDNTYTMMQVSSYDVGDSVDFYDDYDNSDETPGEYLLNLWGHYSVWHKHSLDNIVSKNRHHWWYMVSNMLKFNFYKSNESSIEELDKSIDNGEFTELGNVFIKHNMIDKEFIRMLAHEYFNSMVFKELCSSIRKINDYKKSVENIANSFDII